MYVWVSLRGILRLTRVDTLRGVHTVCFLVIRFIRLSNFRIKYRNLTVIRNPNDVARYKSLAHKQASMNPLR